MLHQMSLRIARSGRLIVFCGVFAVAMAFALYTHHAWEDFYISFRASKNLAMGNGLVYTPGERVHSFTSPGHTLLLAGLSAVTGNHSDLAVLWLSRIVLGALLGVGACLLLGAARKARFDAPASVFLLAFLFLDAKVIDFTINGMDVPLTLFSLMLAIYASVRLSESSTCWPLLGCAWGAMMWSRPDGFAYIGALALGFFVFHPTCAESAVTRRHLLVCYVKAGLLCTVLYLPWVVFAWRYYGSPVPHTILAKGADTHILADLLRFPGRTLVESMFRTLDAVFSPAYSREGDGWYPELRVFYSRNLALIAATYWMIPMARRAGRAVSLTFLLALCYLAIAVHQLFPWYLPSCVALAAFVLACALQDAFSVIKRLQETIANPRGPRSLRSVVAGFAATLVLVHLIITLFVAYQMRIQQRIVEEGNRKQIGLWLRDNAASPDDTVFLEPLGYIGYFSGLRMLDFPGLATPSVVAARRKVGNSWAAVIRELRPDWVVLRPWEVDYFGRGDPELFKSVYKEAKRFDVSDKLKDYKTLPGRWYVTYDQTFIVFRQSKP